MCYKFCHTIFICFHICFTKIKKKFNWFTIHRSTVVCKQAVKKLTNKAVAYRPTHPPKTWGQSRWKQWVRMMEGFTVGSHVTSSCCQRNAVYNGRLDRRLPEHERLNVASWPHFRGQPENACSQVCFQRLNFILNAWRHIAQELVMSCVQNPSTRGNLNLPIIGQGWSNHRSTLLCSVHLNLISWHNIDWLLPSPKSKFLFLATSHLGQPIYCQEQNCKWSDTIVSERGCVTTGQNVSPQQQWPQWNCTNL